jgi:hypothetical protein
MSGRNQGGGDLPGTQEARTAVVEGNVPDSLGVAHVRLHALAAAMHVPNLRHEIAIIRILSIWRLSCISVNFEMVTLPIVGRLFGTPILNLNETGATSGRVLRGAQ